MAWPVGVVRAHLTFDDVTTAFTTHVKDPTNVALRDTGFLFANCHRNQHNACLSAMKCQAGFDASGALQAGCGDAAPAPRAAGLSPKMLPYINAHGVDGCDKVRMRFYPRNSDI